MKLVWLTLVFMAVCESPGEKCWLLVPDRMMEIYIYI